MHNGKIEPCIFVVVFLLHYQTEQFTFISDFCERKRSVGYRWRLFNCFLISISIVVNVFTALLRLMITTTQAWNCVRSFTWLMSFLFTLLQLPLRDLNYFNTSVLKPCQQHLSQLCVADSFLFNAHFVYTNITHAHYLRVFFYASVWPIQTSLLKLSIYAWPPGVVGQPKEKRYSAMLSLFCFVDYALLFSPLYVAISLHHSRKMFTLSQLRTGKKETEI